MNERKIFDLFVLFVIVYCMYSINMWFAQHVEEDTNRSEKKNPTLPTLGPKNETQVVKRKTKAIPLFIKDACSVLEVFTEKPPVKCKHKQSAVEINDNMLTMIGITVFLLILLLNAILEVLKVKEEERARQKLNPDGERRQSLAEFANKKPFRRESSKFGQQLFQITESFVSPDEENKNRRQNRPYTRGDSTNSYLSEINKKTKEGSAPASISESSADTVPRLVKRQSVAKLFGARPVPMVRRSSFPALPLNPDVQALMLGHRQTSVDSDDEGDGRGRRVRIIRRF